jgi:hypothetical protein
MGKPLVSGILIGGRAMRRTFVGFALGLLFLIYASPGEAVSTPEKHSYLVISQCTGEVRAESPLGTAVESKRIADRQIWEIEPGETLSIQVSDPNPLLFTYTWKEAPKTETADFKAITELTASFKNLVSQLNSIPGVAAQTVGGAPPKETAESVLKNFRKDLNALSEHLDMIPQLIEKSGKSCLDAADVKKTVSEWSPTSQKLLQDLDTDLKKIDDWSLKLFKTGQPPPSQDIQNITQAQVLGPRVREMMAKLKSFVELANGIQVPKTFEPPLAFDAAHDSGGTLEIGTVNGNEGVAKDAKVEVKPGQYSFTVSPYSPVHFSVGPAVIYSFIETENFGTKTESGKILIVRKDSGNQVNGLTVGAMLSITPRAWSNPALRGSIQVGASPVKDKIGLFLGGGVQFFNQLSIGGGIAYQQAQRLAKGLAVGQEISSEDKLKTNVIFKPGFYLTVTLGLGGTR